MAAQVLQVLNQQKREWDAKKDRDAGAFDYVTVVLHTEGLPEAVAELPLPKVPKHLPAPPDLEPGFYSFETVAFSDFNKRLSGRVVNLVRCAAPRWVVERLQAALHAPGGPVTGQRAKAE